MIYYLARFADVSNIWPMWVKVDTSLHVLDIDGFTFSLVIVRSDREDSTVDCFDISGGRLLRRSQRVFAGQ